MSAIRLENVTVRYALDADACSAVTLDIGEGELHALLGPSGSGKTTLLRAVAGFQPVSSGAVELFGEPVDGRGAWVPPERRSVGVVFQDYALFPHLSVAKNVAFGARANGGDVTAALLARLGLSAHADRNIDELSGGEQQRVALGRALAQKPKIMLLDEPFSNLNRELRRQLRDDTTAILREEGVTAVFVSHDAEEAFAIADRITVMQGGCVLQTGTAVELYEEPDSEAVALAVGDAQFVDANVEDGGLSAVTALGRLMLRRKTAVGNPARVLVRPDAISLADDGVEARIIRRRYLGGVEELELQIGDQRLRARVAEKIDGNVDTVRVRLTGKTVCV